MNRRVLTQLLLVLTLLQAAVAMEDLLDVIDEADAELITSTVAISDADADADDDDDEGRVVLSEDVNVGTNETYVTQVMSNSTAAPTPNTETAGFDFVDLVTMPIILIIAVLGNTISVMVMLRKQFWPLPMSRILLCLSLSDTMLSLMVPFNKKYVIDALGYDARALSEAGCKIYFWFWKTAKMTSSWFVVTIATERVIAVWFPLKIHKTNMMPIVYGMLAAVYIGIGGFNAVWGVLTGRIVDGFCAPNLGNPGQESLAEGLVICGTLIYSIIPSFLIIIMNGLVVGKLIKQATNRQKLTDSSKRQSTGDTTIRINAMLISVSVCFVVLVVPISITHCISIFKGENIFISDDPLVVWLRHTCSLLEQLNYTINFVLYVLCSQKFRQEVAVLLHLPFWRPQAERTGHGSFSRFTKQTTISRKNTDSVCQQVKMAGDTDDFYKDGGDIETSGGAP